MNSTPFNLYQFIDPTDLRAYLTAPMLHDGLWLASNGHIVLIQPYSETDVYAKNPMPEHVANIFNKTLSACNSLAFEPLMPVEIASSHCLDCEDGVPVSRSCIECEGTGTVTFANNYNNYQCECSSCDGWGKQGPRIDYPTCLSCFGSGQIPYLRNQSVTVNNGCKIAERYALLLQSKSGVVVASDDNMNLLFKHGNQFGCVMRCLY